ncbi:hypothetical protein KC19_VG137900 [Ceratodon purpureus]|uniref:Uncharacterized protein n=1 Tax=Ceratodon purpureus TaxID=3225 RepID=A0A8T0HQY8_CERPU|nr:hypothetical protein KC19_VG137900 [Ceratodon purpureus]
MDPFSSPLNTVAFTSWLLTLLMHLNSLHFAPAPIELEEETDNPLTAIVQGKHDHVDNTESFLRDTLYSYRVCTLYTFFDEEVGF